MSKTHVVVHGHFYQPPREDPWTDRVPRQPSAAPAHDWNVRVHDECYRAVIAAPIHDADGETEEIVNALEWMSWNAGPTLLRWLERERPETYAAFLEADRRSLARTGHGNAIAMPYHHVILPLATAREKRTELRWGIADFRRRFGREPEGMWLPETAVDLETLDLMAQEGIRFTVLAPQQVKEPPAAGRPGRVALPGGRSIAVFVYDGGLSHGIAFGELLEDAQRWVGAIREAAASLDLVSMATDGETFGHHHKWADMALVAALMEIERSDDLRLANYATLLDELEPEDGLEIVEPSAWSCAHGVGRWERDCGCKIDPSADSSQEWRAGLRKALAGLAGAIHARFESEGAGIFDDPWAAREAYGAVLDAEQAEKEAFLDRHGVAPGARPRALELLEMERDALRMDTSCAWFFDDIGGIEPLQNLLYAARAIDLYGAGSDAVEARLVEALAGALSNDEAVGDGARVWRERVRGRSATA